MTAVSHHLGRGYKRSHLVAPHGNKISVDDPPTIRARENDEDTARSRPSNSRPQVLIAGTDNFDCLFRGVQLDEFDGKVLCVYTADEYRAAEIEDTFSPHISTIAAGIL